MSRFAIRSVRSGPDAMTIALPVSGATFDVRASHTAAGEIDAPPFYCATLDSPLQWRPGPGIDLRRMAADHVGADADGPYCWVTAVVMQPLSAEPPYAGMQSFPMGLAFVTDMSLLTDQDVAADKVVFAGVVEIDDIGSSDSTAGPPPHRDDPGPSPVDRVAEVLDRVVADLTALAGRSPAPAALPVRLPSRSDLSEATTPAYHLGADGYGYAAHDPLDGWSVRVSVDVDEVVQWVAEDLAGSVAWAWAQQAPAYPSMPQQHALRTLWLPYWHILLHGLRPDWSDPVRARIRYAYEVRDAALTPPPY